MLIHVWIQGLVHMSRKQNQHMHEILMVEVEQFLSIFLLKKESKVGEQTQKTADPLERTQPT
jgi:hypothetical protein